MTTQLGQPRQRWPIGLQETNNTFRENGLLIILTTKQNKQHGSKSTNYNIQTRPFEPAEESTRFPTGPLERGMETKNVQESYIFYLSSHVIVKRCNITKEITGNDKKICLMGVVCTVSNRKTLSTETFCFSDERLLSILNFLHQVTYCFFASCYLAHNKFSLNVLLFSCNTFGQTCLGGPS